MLIRTEPLCQNQSGDVVKELLLVIYAHLRGPTIAKINEACRNSKGPRLLQIKHWLKLCHGKN